jgi:hypothetical protein
MLAKRMFVGLVMTAGLVGGPCATDRLAAAEKTEPAKEAGWLNDYSAARGVARRTGKPLLVVFR